MAATQIPIAILGRSARFPLADDVETYWKNLAQGLDAVRKIPAHRWDLTRLTRLAQGPVPDHVLQGGWLDDIFGFDPGRFRISPREARTIDPKQRLALLTALACLEDAGLAPDTLPPDARVGVFVGVSRSEYLQRFYERGEVGPASGDRYLGSGCDMSFTAGRMAAAFGFVGPSLNLDTACSTGLVAVDHAVHALQDRRCEYALAGASHVIMAPEFSVLMSRFGILSPHGRCQAFDAGADGYVRGEGAGFVLLKRLDDALADGDDVLAVILGTATNSNGRSDNLMAPQYEAQVKLLQALFQESGCSADTVGAVEAHGTGTKVGDPIEIRALLASLGAHRSEPLWVSSVKTQIGHLELAAGMAGLIRAIESIRHAQIPPHLHLHTLNPAIPDDAPIRFPRALSPWSPIDGQHTILVNSFGISGTNAAALLCSAPAPLPRAVQPPPPHVALQISAHDRESLHKAAARAQQALEHGTSPAALARSLDLCREQLPLRLAFATPSAEHASEHLLRWLEGDASAIPLSEAPAPAPGAWMFTGQGSQHVSMGVALLAHVPSFARAVAELDRVFSPLLGLSMSALWSGEVDLDDTRWTQPALFGLEWALAQTWLAVGLQPGVLIGHSIGEIVAAQIAGVLSLQDAASLIDARARLMAELPREGVMSAVMLDAEPLQALLADERDVGIGTDNGPRGAVLSGRTQAVEAIEAKLSAQDIPFKRLHVSHAFHSACMDPMLAAFEAVTSQLTFHPAQIPIASNVTGKLETELFADPSYWARHIRSCVRFSEGVQAAHALQPGFWLEIGPQAVLSGMVRRILRAKAPLIIPSLRKDIEQTDLADAIATLHLHAVPLDRRALWRDYAVSHARLGPSDLHLRKLEVEEVHTPNPSTPPARTALQGHVTRWLPIPTPTSPSSLVGRWVVGLDRAGRLRSLVQALRGLGADVLVVSTEPTPGSDLILAPSHMAQWRELPAFHGPIAGWIDGWSLDDSDPTDASWLEALTRVSTALAGAAQVLDQHASAEARLFVLTPALLTQASPQNLAAGAAWGMLPTVIAETKPRSAHAMDLEAGLDPTSILPWLQGETPSALRLSHAGAFAPAQVQLALESDTSWPVRGTWLITGGLGGLGRSFATHLAKRGAARVLLASRHAPSAEVAAWLSQARAQGLPLEALQLDVTHAHEVDALFRSLDGTQPPLRGILHAAGTLADRPLRRMDAQTLRTPIPAKALGAWNLHQASLRLSSPLDAFVLFSSVTAKLGAPGQSGYGAANGVLDAVARMRAAQGLAALSLQWGPWAEVGMAADLGDLMRSRGIEPTTPDDGLARFDAVLFARDPVIALFQWAGHAPTPPRETHAVPAAAEARPVPLPSASTPAPSSDGLLEAITAITARLLGFEPGEVDVHKPLAWQGLDSILAVDLRGMLKSELGVELPLDAVVGGPRPTELVALALKAGVKPPTPPKTKPVSTQPAPSDTPALGPTEDTLPRLAREVEQLLGFEPGELVYDKPLAWQGLDSILAVDLGQKIEAVWQVKLPTDFLVTGPRVTEIAARLPPRLTSSHLFQPDLSPDIAPASEPEHGQTSPPQSSTQATVEPEKATEPPRWLWGVLLVCLLGVLAIVAQPCHTAPVDRGAPIEAR